MRDYIQPVIGIEDMTDSIEKIAPALLAAGRGMVMSAAAEAAKNKLEGLATQTEDATAELEQAEEADAANAQAGESEEGDGAEIEGMNNPDSIPPTEQEGTELPAIAPELGKMRTWFPDNFGMTGREMTEILIKARENKVLDAIQPLLRLEKQATLSHFVAVSPDLIDELPLTDLDYDALNKNMERLDLPFRRFVKTWESDTSDDGREQAEKLWRMTIDKSERLSHRERGILRKCQNILSRRGAVNAQILKSHGVQASPAEISSLIKSHGFLFDIIAVGQFSKTVGRGLFYDIKRSDIILKDADQFLAGLIENGGGFKFDSRFYPRLEISFNAPSAPWYADALRKEGIDNVEAKGIGLIIEGETSVLKALELAEPHLNGKTKSSRSYPTAHNMLSALRGDKDTLIVMAYDCLEGYDKAKLLRKHRLTVDDFDDMKAGVIKSG